MDTWADATSYLAAVNLRRNYSLAQAQFCTLNWTGGNFTGQWLLVKVVSVRSSIAAGSLNGFGSEAQSGAVIRGLWTMRVQAIAGTSPG